MEYIYDLGNTMNAAHWSVQAIGYVCLGVTLLVLLHMLLSIRKHRKERESKRLYVPTGRQKAIEEELAALRSKHDDLVFAHQQLHLKQQKLEGRARVLVASLEKLQKDIAHPLHVVHAEEPSTSFEQTVLKQMWKYYAKSWDEDLAARFVDRVGRIANEIYEQQCLREADKELKRRNSKKHLAKLNVMSVNGGEYEAEVSGHKNALRVAASERCACGSSRLNGFRDPDSGGSMRECRDCGKIWHLGKLVDERVEDQEIKELREANQWLRDQTSRDCFTGEKK